MQDSHNAHAHANSNQHVPPASVALRMAQTWREGARGLHDGPMTDAVAGVTGGE